MHRIILFVTLICLKEHSTIEQLLPIGMPQAVRFCQKHLNCYLLICILQIVHSTTKYTILLLSIRILQLVCFCSKHTS